MPSFDSIDSVYTPQRKLTEAEVLRAIKFGISSEYETIQIYQQIMESTDDEDVKTVLADITNDEMHHAGALLKLLEILSPDEARQYQHGIQKALQEIGQNKA